MRAGIVPLSKTRKMLALSGGVGGAKLVAGLAAVLPAEALTVAVNVGDDFEHLGLTICPDLDTVLYTLAGLAHPQQGWGRADESWQMQDELRRLGGLTWFQLGDRDLALHLLRRELLDRGLTLSATMEEIARRFGVSVRVLPISDAPLRTIVNTDEGPLPFQDYFVRRRCEPRLKSLHFESADRAELAPGVLAVLDDPNLGGVILCPSNPYLSVAPMLAVQGLRERLRQRAVPVIAVSPIVNGQALKGPTAKIMCELGVEVSSRSIADLYSEIADHLVVDSADAALAQDDARIAVTKTIMHTESEKVALARFCLDLISAQALRMK